MIVWRLARKKYAALDGEGSRIAGGRWNSHGGSVVYTAGSLSLAVLELLVHVDPEDAPNDLLAYQIEIPDNLKIESISPSDLPGTWQVPEHEVCKSIGDGWISSQRTPILRVPSSIVPEESNYLINPGHPDISGIDIVSKRKFFFDKRLLEIRKL